MPPKVCQPTNNLFTVENIIGCYLLLTIQSHLTFEKDSAMVETSGYTIVFWKSIYSNSNEHCHVEGLLKGENVPPSLVNEEYSQGQAVCLEVLQTPHFVR